MNLTAKHNYNEFIQFLLGEIDLDAYKYKFLNDTVEKITTFKKPLYNLSFISITCDGWVLFLHSDTLMIYGENWNTLQLQEMGELFDINKYSKYTVSGDEELINELFAMYQPNNFEVDKRRLFYKAHEINLFNGADLKIKQGTADQLEELAIMLQQYYHEEYNGQNDKTIEEMRERMLHMIQSEKIFVLLNADNIILSFCTIIDPDIGILFTKNEHRNNGYGKIILSHCSNLLRTLNATVYLMTDTDKTASNRAAEKVGFTPYFKHSMTRINIRR